MPFTISHTAAVLPLFRRNLSRSALLIGSMIPDLPLFLAAGRYDVSHSAAGILLYNLPVGLFAWLIWNNIMRTPSRMICPAPLQAVLFDHHDRSVSKIRVFLGLILGSATHVIWDGFTHLNAFGPEILPVLLTEVAGHPVYSWLQVFSSLAGMLLLLRWIYGQWDFSIKYSRTDLVRFLSTWLLLLGCCIGYAMISSRFADGRFYLYGTIIMSMQLFFCSWFLLCVMLRPLIKNEGRDTVTE